MKLNLGNNIKKYRKEKDMTQEALAEYLGVSSQAVSRWENDTTYPDVELIPVLANLFGVSTDVLFDMKQTQKETAATEVLTALAELTRQQPLNVSLINELIREVRLHYIDCDCFWNFWLSVNRNAYRHESILPEVRALFNTIVEGKFDIYKKVEAIKHFSVIEDDEHLDDLLKQHATTSDLSEKALLYNRYLCRGENDNIDLYRQKYLFEYVDHLVGNSSMWLEKGETINIPKIKAATELQLQLLHGLCQHTPNERHPISGNGQVDLWVEARLWLGFHYTAFCAHIGETDKAFAALEDTVSLLEKVSVIQNTKLSANSPWLESIVWTAEEDYVDGSFSGLYDKTTLEKVTYIHNEQGACYIVYPSVYYGFLTTEKDDKWYTRYSFCFDNIRNSEQYISCVKRVKSLIQMKEA